MDASSREHFPLYAKLYPILESAGFSHEYAFGIIDRLTQARFGKILIGHINDDISVVMFPRTKRTGYRVAVAFTLPLYVAAIHEKAYEDADVALRAALAAVNNPFEPLT